MRQTMALLIDAYREMNSRKLFWIALILSTVVAASFFAVGISDAGVSIFGHVFFSDYNTRYVARSEFYKEFFVGYGIDFWFSLIGVVLALVTTASIFPDFLAGGAIDLYLSKPIGRLRLFLTKYLCGLLFVALQLFCFCLMCFLVIGIRGGEWLPGIFLAVPIVLLFFSYLFAISVFWGVWTRSTIASLLLTILAWFVIFGVHGAEVMLLRIEDSTQLAAQRVDQRIAAESAELKRLDEEAARQAADPPATDPSMAPATQPAISFWKNFLPPMSGNSPPKPRTRSDIIRDQLARDHEERAQYTDNLKGWHESFYFAMTLLPKTSETVDLLTRVLLQRTGMQNSEAAQQSDDRQNVNARQETEIEATQKLTEQLRSRSVTWVAGTSVGFELVVLGVAAWMFCRRDY